MKIPRYLHNGALSLLLTICCGLPAWAQSSLVAHYTFDDPEDFTPDNGDAVIDSSGNNRHGTEGSNLTWSADGVRGGAIVTTAATNGPHFSTAFAPGLIAGDSFTISFWVKTGATGTGDNYKDWGRLDFSDGTTTQHVQLRSLPVAAPDNGGFYFRDPAYAFWPTNPAVNLKNNAWHMVTAVADGTTLTLFTDGGNPVVFTNYQRGGQFSLTGLRIGNGNGTSVGAVGTVALAGVLDDVRLYDGPLSAAEVADLHTATVLGEGLRTWAAATTSNTWLQATNWTGDGPAAFPGETNNPASDNRDMASIGDFAFAPASGLRIDMNAAGGSLALGAIRFDSATAGLTIGNGSASMPGTLLLNGATINGIANTVVAVAGAHDLTLANTPNGAPGAGLTVLMGYPNSVFQVAAGRSLTITAALDEFSPGSPLILRGGGMLALTGPASFSGAIQVSGHLELGANSVMVPSLTLSSGSITGSGTITATQTTGFLITNTEGSATLGANLTGNVNLRKEGAGTLVVTGENSNNEATIIAGGVLSVANIADSGASHIGITGGVNSRLSIVGGTLRYTGSGAQATSRNLWMDQVRAGIEITEPTGSLTLTPQGGTRSAPFTKSGPGTLALTGAFSGTASVTVAGGTLRLGAANTHSGTTSVAAGGKLVMGHTSALQNSTLDLATAATAEIDATEPGEYLLGGLAGAGTLTAPGHTLLVGGNGASTTFSGQLDAALLVKQGGGRLTLDPAASFGTTAIRHEAGTLVLPGGGSFSRPIELTAAASQLTLDLASPDALAVDYLVVGGGGGGGGRDSSGGGGGGGVLSNLLAAEPRLSLASGPTSVFVGDGGAGGANTTRGANGQTSSLGPVSAFGGGAGAPYNGPAAAGASGGGGGREGTAVPGGAGTPGQGFAGGAGSNGTNAAVDSGGGGGGAGQPGATAVKSAGGGKGGDGHEVDIDGTPKFFGGGGGGTPHRATPALPSGAGGAGGGGAGALPFAEVNPGLPNTGGGGGASRSDQTATWVGGKGGSGIVVLRYPGAPRALGGTITAGTGSAAGYTIHTFTAEGAQALHVPEDGTINAPITGSGGFTFAGFGTLTLAATHTYTGDTLVPNGTLNLQSGAQLAFAIGADGVNNRIAGGGSGSFHGTFHLDLASADATPGNEWRLVDLGSASFGGSFAVTSTAGAFTRTGTTHALNQGGLTWTFNETTGVLSVGEAAPTGFAAWIDGFFPGETDPAIVGPAADPNGDGVANSLVYLFGGDPKDGNNQTLLPTATLATNPGGPVPNGNYLVFTYRRDATAQVTAAVEHSTTLAAPWTTAANDVDGVVVVATANGYASGIDKVEVFIPRSGARMFGRLSVSETRQSLERTGP